MNQEIKELNKQLEESQRILWEKDKRIDDLLDRLDRLSKAYQELAIQMKSINQK